MTPADGSSHPADLLFYPVLIVVVLLVCLAATVVARRLRARAERPPEPSAEERTRLAVERLEQAGVDVPALLGGWIPDQSRK